MVANIPQTMSKNQTDNHRPDCPPPGSRNDRLGDPMLSQDLRRALRAALPQLARGDSVLHRPPPQVGWQPGAHGHYHSAPELFLQISGWTHFTFPQGTCRLLAGQALLLPPHLQHAETVGSDASGPFSNLVFYAEGPAFSAHLADAQQPGLPEILHLEARTTPLASNMAQWLLAASQPTPDVDAAIDDWRARGLVGATLAQALLLLEQAATEQRDEPPLVARVRLLVKNQLGDPGLSVRGLASQGGCTADYLSHLFHRHAGEHLVAYITRLRMERAVQLLDSSGMAVKEVAWACGYSGPGYFIQAFRRHHGVTPSAWRQR